jgi:PAS domain S-box-containing protein
MRPATQATADSGGVVAGAAGVVDLFGFASESEALEFLGSVLRSSTEYSMVSTDLDGTIVVWNEGARRLYGYEPSEIVGLSKSVLHIEEDVASGLPRRMMDAARDHGSWTGSVERKRKDGSTFTARVGLTARRAADGRIAGFLLMSSDVTEETRLTAELERSRAYTRSVLESAPDAMVIVDAGGEIQLANAATEAMFGYTRGELIGSSVEMLIPERYRAGHPGHREGFFGHPRPRAMGAGLELSGVRKDGGECPVEISLSPLQTEDGLFATAAIRDASERKRFEHELRETNVQLQAASRAKDRFLATMSHELRTPLNAILGFTGILLMGLPGPLNDEQSKQLRAVQTSGRHLLSLINDMLDLAKIESGTVKPNREPIDCQQLLQDVALGLQPLANKKGLELEVIAGAQGLEVLSDRRALSQILINLVNNAIKFTDEGAVRVGVGRGDREGARTIRFTVSDTGPGIKATDQERIFAAFEQLDDSTTRATEGTGLGLYICQTLATFIGATITFESEYGNGSSFTVELSE